jgi:hypothetical protein
MSALDLCPDLPGRPVCYGPLVSDRICCADLTNILPSFSLFWMLILPTVKQQEHVSK